MRKSWISGLLGLTLCISGTAHGALSAIRDFPINGVRPSTDSYTGGGITFIPANTDSVAQDTLVINWNIKDPVVTTKYNQIFQRITIPTSSTAPTVLATATIRYDTLLDGTNTFDGTGSARPSDLVFDAANKKLVTVSGSSNGPRFFWFDLFNSDTTVSSANLGYSAKFTDNFATSQVKTIVATPDGQYTSFYTSGTNICRVSTSLTAGNNVATTKTIIDAKTSFTGWYPDTSVLAPTLAGFDCEGGVAYGNSILLLREYKLTSTTVASELYQVNNTLDTAAFNNATSLGNLNALAAPLNGNYVSQNLMGYGLTLNGSTAFVRYGTTNDPSGGSYGRILMVSIPEPATLVLMLAGLALPMLRRRRSA